MIQLNASLFVKRGGYTIAGYPFDLVLSESHELVSEIAEHPVDEQSNIATHIHNKLREGELEGLISNWSLNAPLFVSDAWLNFVGLGSGPNRVVDFFQVLKDLRDKKELFDIVLGLDTYTDVFFTSIRAERNADTGDAQTFRVRFKELKTVKLARTDLTIVVSPDNPIDPLTRQASPTSNQGQQSGITL